MTKQLKSWAIDGVLWSNSTLNEACLACSSPEFDTQRPMYSSKNLSIETVVKP